MIGVNSPNYRRRFAGYFGYFFLFLVVSTNGFVHDYQAAETEKNGDVDMSPVFKPSSARLHLPHRRGRRPQGSVSNHHTQSSLFSTGSTPSVLMDKQSAALDIESKDPSTSNEQDCITANDKNTLLYNAASAPVRYAVKGCPPSNAPTSPRDQLVESLTALQSLTILSRDEPQRQADDDAEQPMLENAPQAQRAFIAGGLLTLVSSIMSPLLISLMSARRKKFPFSKLNIHLLITTELAIWAALLYVGTSGTYPTLYTPCIVALYFWENNFFPCLTFILLNTIKLSIDYRVAHDKVYDRESYFYRHARLLQHPLLLVGIGFIFFLWSWMGVFEQIYKTMPIWFYDYTYNDYECVNFPQSATLIDQVNGFLLAGVLALVLYVGLKDVQEVMGAKKAFLAGGLCLCLYSTLYDLLILSGISDTLLSHEVEIGIYLVYFLHFYSWTVSLPLVWISFSNPLGKLRTRQKTLLVIRKNFSVSGGNVAVRPAASKAAATATAGTEGKVLVAGTNDGQAPYYFSPGIFFASAPKDVMTAIGAATGHELAGMKEYFQKELSVENLLFLASSVLYKQIASEEKRVEKVREMIEEFLLDTSPLEIKISTELRRAILRAANSEGTEDTVPTNLNGSTTDALEKLTSSRSSKKEETTRPQASKRKVSLVEGAILQVARRLSHHLEAGAAVGGSILRELIIKTEPPGSVEFWNAVDDEVAQKAMEPFNRFVSQYEAKKLKEAAGGASKANNKKASASSSKTAPVGGTGRCYVQDMKGNWLATRLKAKAQTMSSTVSDEERIEWWKEFLVTPRD